MSRQTPALTLRIGAFTLAISVLCLLALFLTSSSLDPLIQAAAMFFYLASILAMGLTMRHQFLHQAEEPPGTQAAEIDNTPELTGEQSGDEEIGEHTPPSQNEAPTTPLRQTSLLLSRHQHTSRMIETCYADWGKALITAGSCAEASQKLLNLLQENPEPGEVTLLIDTAGLEIDAIHLPALIRQDATRTSLRFIGIVDQQQTPRLPHLQEAGYCAFVEKPIDKSQLFSVINPSQTDEQANAKVVDLARYRKKTERQSRKRILLADKNSAERKRLADLLGRIGHRVKLVENGEQALDALERQRYDIALLNLELPIMNGTQVIKLHRFTTPHAQWVSFIIMTDQTTPATLRTCRELQVTACLFKPVPTDTLSEFIDKAPVVSQPASASVEPSHGAPPRVIETQFLHADLLDTQVLKGLEHLDSDNDFVPDLIAIFGRDSSAILQRMEESVEFDDSKHFVELSNVLMDNAGQLGAFALYESCLALQRMSPEDLRATLPAKLARLRDLVERTSAAFQQYLNERRQQHSDMS